MFTRNHKSAISFLPLNSSLAAICFSFSWACESDSFFFFFSYSDEPPICQGNYGRGQIVIRFFCSTECLSLLPFFCRYFLYCVICIATLIEYLMFHNERMYCAGILENDSFMCAEVEWQPNFIIGPCGHTFYVEIC